MSYVIFDFETTGLLYKEEQIIEFSAKKLDDSLNVVSEISHLVALEGDRVLPQFIRQLTGISQADLDAEGIPLEEAYAKLVEFIGDSIVVAQYASFDLAFLSKAMTPEKFICTRSMARLLRPNEYASLKNLVKHYNIKNDNPHRASADVDATVEVFKLQKAECEAKGIEYLNVLIDSNERPLSYIPDNAVVHYMEFPI